MRPCALAGQAESCPIGHYSVSMSNESPEPSEGPPEPSDQASAVPERSDLELFEHGVKAITVSPASSDAPTDLTGSLGGPTVPAGIDTPAPDAGMSAVGEPDHGPPPASPSDD